ncbi:hypothetical protein GCM10022222_71020 [Amycolatopsis ultiminotia]|uniref:Integrase catalytic domain-containing protein n=1 Tax=Amycolatopsis ultiminotia TaxID=543629 RepID=A0ABP6Y4T7_9PSEU
MLPAQSPFSGHSPTTDHATSPASGTKLSSRLGSFTNGKAERFNRTLLDEWAYAQPYQSETQRRETFPRWLHTYNHHRSHTTLAGHPPASRISNLPGQYN